MQMHRIIAHRLHVSFLAADAMHRRVTAPTRSKKRFVRRRGWRRCRALLYYRPIKPLSLTIDRFLGSQRDAEPPGNLTPFVPDTLEKNSSWI